MNLVALQIQRSQGFSGVTKTTKNGMQAESVGCLVVLFNFKYFGYKSLSGPAFDLHNDIQRVRDIRLDGAIGHFYAALQDARSETGNALSS